MTLSGQGLRFICLLLLAPVVWVQAGCFNYWEQATRTRSFQVLSKPPGALIIQQGKDGRQELGLAPVTVQRSYKVKVRKFRHWTWLFPGLFAFCAGAAAAAMSEEDTTSDEWGESDGNDGLATLAGICTIGAIAAIANNIVGTIRAGKEIPLQTEPLVFRAKTDGLPPVEETYTFPSGPSVLTLNLTGSEGPANVRLASSTSPGAAADLDRPAPYQPAGVPAHSPRNDGAPDRRNELKPPVAGGSTPAPVVRRKGKPLIVAVFDVQDAAGRFKRNDLIQLTEYLSAKLTQVARFRVVPRKTLRNQLVEGKKEGYKTCYDESCQIELGRAVAAEKSLSTKLLKIGGTCAISATLYDLKTEIAEVAASIKTSCSEEGLVDGMDRVANQLAREVR